MPIVQPIPILLPPRIDKGKVTSIDDRRHQISEENGRGNGRDVGSAERVERNY